MTIRHLKAADFRDMPWANGRGVTTELVRMDGPDGLVYRLSVATVSEDGPFSALPGVDRILTLLDGEGFDLLIDGERHSLSPLAPIAFTGEAEVSAVAVKGRTTDFNVMCGRARASATVSVVTGADEGAAGAGVHFVYAVGAATFGNHALAAGDLLAIEGEPVPALRAGGPILHIRIDIA